MGASMPACKRHLEVVVPSSSALSSGTAASAGAPAASPAGATSDRAYAREWLYRLVMFPSYFTPCHGCCMGNRTPKREQLLTHFDTQCPSRIYCSHCPEYKHRLPWLLQVGLRGRMRARGARCRGAWAAPAGARAVSASGVRSGADP